MHSEQPVTDHITSNVPPSNSDISPEDMLDEGINILEKLCNVVSHATTYKEDQVKDIHLVNAFEVARVILEVLTKKFNPPNEDKYGWQFIYLSQVFDRGLTNEQIKKILWNFSEDEITLSSQMSKTYIGENNLARRRGRTQHGKLSYKHAMKIARDILKLPPRQLAFFEHFCYTNGVFDVEDDRRYVEGEKIISEGEEVLKLIGQFNDKSKPKGEALQKS